MKTIDRRAYAEMYGPTTGDRVRLGDSDLVIEIERDLGPDIMMPLDECPPSNAERKIVEEAVGRTLLWAERSMDHVQKTKPLHGYKQAPFLIVQGGVHRDL